MDHAADHRKRESGDGNEITRGDGEGDVKADCGLLRLSRTIGSRRKRESEVVSSGQRDEGGSGEQTLAALGGGHRFRSGGDEAQAAGRFPSGWGDEWWAGVKYRRKSDRSTKFRFQDDRGRHRKGPLLHD